MAGFASERYSVGLKAAWEKAKSLIMGRLRRNITKKIKADHNSTQVRGLHVRTSYSAIKYKYLLLPVWMACFKYNNKVYRFMVNGQTGKVSGRIPISPFKVFITVLGLLGILALALVVYNL